MLFRFFLSGFVFLGGRFQAGKSSFSDSVSPWCFTKSCCGKWATWEIRKVIQQFVATNELATKWTRINPQDSLQGLVKGFGMATESVGSPVHSHTFYWKILLMVQKSC